MGRAARRPDAWLIVLGSISLIAWSELALGRSGLTLPTFCSPGMRWAAPLPLSFDLALAFNSPAKLVAGWAVMIAAMMSPLVVAPFRHLHDRSFASRRARAMLVFAAGYAAVWMVALAGLQAFALALRWAAPGPLICLGLAAAIAMAWQLSPVKQWFLNRCHRRPPLAAFGAVADRDAFHFGLTNGGSCAGACWALMLLALVAPRAHIAAMFALTLFVFAERFESPAALQWRWRGAGKALRVINAQAHLRLALRGGVRNASSGP